MKTKRRDTSTPITVAIDKQLLRNVNIYMAEHNIRNRSRFLSKCCNRISQASTRTFATFAKQNEGEKQAPHACF